MFQWRTFSDQNRGRKEGDLEVGGGMEDHIQASGGAAGPSQTQVDNDRHPPAFKNQCDEHDVRCSLVDYSHFQGNKGVEENNVRNQYSIPGILHFIQHEWARWVNLINHYLNQVDLST